MHVVELMMPTNISKGKLLDGVGRPLYVCILFTGMTATSRAWLISILLLNSQYIRYLEC